MLTRRKTHSMPGLCCALDLRENPPLQNQLKTRKENTADTSQPEDLAGRPCPSPRPPVLGGTEHRQGPSGPPPGTGRVLEAWQVDAGSPRGPPSPAWAPSCSKEPSAQNQASGPRARPALRPAPALPPEPAARPDPHITHPFLGTEDPSPCRPGPPGHCVNGYSARESHFCAIKRNSASSLKRNAVDQVKHMKPRT